ncbi:MAG: hypothetical protein L0332_00110 [Chloroflexi bacterium]|nr:hypothetical protein [Chloroflexota bacterium]MCI0649835.1 hypothetical protein [Chloroflexota bacterium]MCI0725126.1 hypothetical protein [Chloroflexota bacterium]
MSAYDLEQLIHLWTTEKLTAEQTIGQLLLQLQLLSGRVGELERRLEELRRAEANVPKKRSV